MLRPSYNQLINKANENAPENEPVVRSRYSIVLAAAKRARQLVDGNKTYVDGDVRKDFMGFSDMRDTFKFKYPE